MSSVRPALLALVEDAYRVFAEDPPRGALYVCRCSVCMDESTMRELVRTPLRSIPSALLAQYTNSAHEWNDVAERELRYFLPRYLELIAHGDPPDDLGLAICLRRLTEAKWKERWLPRESALLDGWFRELLMQTIAQIQAYRRAAGYVGLEHDLGEILTLAISAGADLEPLLEAWRRHEGIEANVHLASLMTTLRADDGGWYPSTPFLDSHRPQALRIGAFARDPSWKPRLERSFFAVDDPLHQQLLSDALELIG